MEEIARKHPDLGPRAAQAIAQLFAHVPIPPSELFQQIETKRDGVVPLWRDVPAGSFLMGSPEGEGHDNEHPYRNVEIPHPLRVAAVPVTHAQYLAFDPRHSVVGCPEEEVPERQRGSHPVAGVSWFEAAAFCRFLDRRVPGCAGAGLLTDPEWEYACRAGSTTRYWSGDTKRDLARVGWYEENSQGRTHQIGEKPANPWGLYDVHGNVWAWTSSLYAREEGEDAASGDRVIRGGSCRYGADSARSACRNWLPARFRREDLGFRVVLPAPSRL